MSKVITTKEFNDCIFLNTVCECSCSDHDLDICVEYDDELHMVSIIFYNNLLVFKPFGFWKSLKWKVVNIFKIMFGIPIVMTGDFIFSGEKHIEELIGALKKCKDRVEKSKNCVVYDVKYYDPELDKDGIVKMMGFNKQEIIDEFNEKFGDININLLRVDPVKRELHL